MLTTSFQKNIRTYSIQDSCIFKKNREAFGDLSNMAPFKINVNNVVVKTSEALYQACKFTDYPDIQLKIIDEKSPMTAKMVSRAYKSMVRSDWEKIKVRVMHWCLRVKIAQHFIRFGITLESTGQKDIVEDSKSDNFWGAIRQNNNTYTGVNALGRLLMELRDKYISYKKYELLFVPKPDIINFKLNNDYIDDIDERYNFIRELTYDILNLDENVIFNYESQKQSIKRYDYINQDEVRDTNAPNKIIDNKILNILQTGPYTSKEIIEKANLDMTPRKLTQHLKKMKDYIIILDKKPLRFKLLKNINREQTTYSLFKNTGNK